MTTTSSKKKKKKKRTGSIEQQFYLQREVQGPVMRLASSGSGSGRSYYRSVIEVTGTFFNQFDEENQQDTQEMYHRLFLGLDFPLQIVVSVRPLNIEAYLQFADPRPGPQPWRTLAHSHAEFLRASVKRRPLLGRRFFIIIPAEEEFPAAAAMGLFAAMGQENGHNQQEMDMSQAALILRTRFETISYHLQSIGSSCRLLTNRKLAAFYRNFFLPNKPPLSLTVERDHLKLNEDQYIRVQQIDTLPRLVAPGWFKPLVELDETFDLVHHLSPRSAADSLSYLRRQQTHAQASVLYAATAGRSTPASAAIANNDLGPLVEAVTSGEVSMLNSSLHLIIRATSKDELEKRTRRINQRINTVFTRRPRPCTFEQVPAFQACLPGSIGGRSLLLIPSQAVATMLPFFDHFVFSPKETAILEGMTQHSEPVIMDWWSDLSNANRLIFGPSGQGKSYKAKLDILRLFYVYKNLAQRQQKQEDGFQILIIDPERETNRAPGFSLVESLGGQSIRFSPGSAHRLNPLDLPAVAAASQMEIDMKEDVLKNHIQRLHRILDTMLAYNTDDQQNTLNPQEKSLLDAALYETYRRAGIFADRETHSRPAPLLRDLYDVLLEGICGPDDTDLAPRLRRYTHGSLSGLFSERTNINLNNSCVQFDIKELESELRPVGFMLISQYIWNIAFSSPLPRFLFIDELATIGRYKSGQYFLEEIFQRARKYGVSVTGMTQDAGSLSNTIIANSAMHILLHQNDNTIDRATDLFKLSGREAQHVRSFDKGEALLLAAGKRMIVKFSASPEEDRLITTNRRQIEALEAAAAAQKSGSVS